MISGDIKVRTSASGYHFLLTIRDIVPHVKRGVTSGGSMVFESKSFSSDLKQGSENKYKSIKILEGPGVKAVKPSVY